MIDAPQWVADPTLDALQVILPAPLRGFVADFQNQALGVRDAVRQVVLGPDQTLDPPDGWPEILTVSQDVTPSAASITTQGTSNVIEAAAQDSTSPASVPQAIFKKRPLLNVVRGADTSSLGTKGRKPVANVQTQLRTAAQDTQNQITNVTTNTVKRFTGAVERIGKHATVGASSSRPSTGDAGTK